MGFQYPFFLLLLLFIPIYWWLRVKWHNTELKLLRLFVRPVLWERVKITPPPLRLLSRILWITALALSITALSSPTWGRSSAITSTGSKNLVIALDVSQSMASMDEMPSRIARAASEVRRLAEELIDVRIALVVFSGSSRLASPLTLDREFLMNRLPDNVWSSTDIIPGTKLGDMVNLMVSTLPKMDLEASLGIIFSDGGFHDYATESAVEEANHHGMNLITVGVGGPIEVPIPNEEGGLLLDAQEDTVRTSLEEGSLRELAEKTGGVYVRLSGTDDLISVVKTFLEHISAENSELATGGSSRTRRYQYFLLSALLFFTAAIILERRGL
ncbi:MAG: VWA domain-containing protein [Candidatus Aegiribacteria sp.]|nr:VWA domain-containing protein [Candidatus Aegiribacteria sp.]